MTDKLNEQDKLWVKCPAGAIQKVADSALVTRAVKPAADLQRRKLLIAAATAASVAVIGGVGYLATREPAAGNGSAPGAGVPMADYSFGGIKCSELVQILPAYIEKTIDDQEKTTSIEKHLERCYRCRKIYEDQLQS